MKALLIIAHGSRRADANRHLERLTSGIAAEAGDRFSKVRCAYLQHSKPLAGEVIAELVEQGVNHITLLPFFLSEGGHVRSDIPELVRSAGERFPEVVFEIKPFLGELTGLKALILDNI